MLATFPQDIQTSDDTLTITWKDGFVSHYNLLDLRKKCPCAVCCGGHGGTIGAATGHINEIKLISWRKVGRYALNFTWSDHHDSGIYSYDNLRAYSESKAELS
ncbi:MAG TPA: DUF971 domain-containing protein [Leptospiraceae bacterium]|nr:DUF971 domain-containing protein [Leptospiraceae bacterium]HMW06609.1 DUF971 domain-containing protein [Leptospiraceae bacterium]HMX32037.1 DUF971 domain-containing protein [Leptospiraceae bacterium]HMY31200.1 DUF971 domain-containing protein [Leptospiraceae bacterium]HMZ63313.1 DUF971 domain-containing protein [Leptospiraceae bacterium]